MVIVYIRPSRLVCESGYRRRLDMLNSPCYLKLNSKEILAPPPVPYGILVTKETIGVLETHFALSAFLSYS